MFRINWPGSTKQKKWVVVILVIIVLGVLFNYMQQNKKNGKIDNKINIETTIKQN
ncbi:hypothetical protein [uncultured Clostridium sp.]|uniref:hypothetical protein n=1 Tax=uncultured Clostridium sp. TaxID=59620 RepID=UPI002624BFCE|nr:hypothetical protein [uncultured Clostridium sp.]